jgi:hypothetical protein
VGKRVSVFGEASRKVVALGTEAAGVSGLVAITGKGEKSKEKGIVDSLVAAS